MPAQTPTLTPATSDAAELVRLAVDAARDALIDAAGGGFDDPTYTAVRHALRDVLGAVLHLDATDADDLLPRGRYYSLEG